MKGSGKGMEGSGRAVLMVRVSEETKRRVWRAAYDTGLCQSDILRLAIKHYLAVMDMIKEKSRKRENSKIMLGVGIQRCIRDADCPTSE